MGCGHLSTSLMLFVGVPSTPRKNVGLDGSITHMEYVAIAFSLKWAIKGAI
jgi:hypothetical protein